MSRSGRVQEMVVNKWYYISIECLPGTSAAYLGATLAWETMKLKLNLAQFELDLELR